MCLRGFCVGVFGSRARWIIVYHSVMIVRMPFRCHMAFPNIQMSQHVTTCHNMSQHVTTCHNMSQHVTTCHNMSQHVTTTRKPGWCHPQKLAGHRWVFSGIQPSSRHEDTDISDAESSISGKSGKSGASSLLSRSRGFLGSATNWTFGVTWDSPVSESLQEIADAFGLEHHERQKHRASPGPEDL